MGYHGQQHSVRFKITDQAGAQKALAKKYSVYGEDDSLEVMFAEIGWDYFPDDGELDYMNQGDSKISSECDAFFGALAPYVKHGSYISMIGDDNAIWRWYFDDGTCRYQPGTLSFPEPGEEKVA